MYDRGKYGSSEERWTSKLERRECFLESMIIEFARTERGILQIPSGVTRIRNAANLTPKSHITSVTKPKSEFVF